ncbi:MAG: ASKHA domain-containing protein [Candidatus Nezhaarchaeales archaeon]|nr:MAG: ferredoxin [Candidatus Nezhaarchaeota archaeon WYZ-LMO8]TDA36702.1 MAG: ferredoxin [Candidatus Nezhaarchaeota archaeon WYZ-LMO7]
MVNEDLEKIAVVFEPQGRKVEVKKGMTILDAARVAGIGIRSDCGGLGLCGKCLVIVEDQLNLSSTSNVELQHIPVDKLRKGFRLACQSIIKGNVRIFVPHESRLETRKILSEGVGRHFELDPAIRKMQVNIPRPNLHDITPDFERLCSVLRDMGFTRIEMDHELMQKLPIILRRADWKITVTLWMEREVISLEEDGAERAFGVSIDVGTSKIVIHLVNLTSGETVSIKSMENPQITYGEDIISRINYAVLREDGLRRLQELVLEAINTLIDEACREAGVKKDCVYEVTVVGNTAMHHILLGYNPKQLAIAPYVPVVKQSINVKAKHLGLKVNPFANVYVLPIIAGFVGADAVADVLASGIHEADEVSLLVDIGTNSEVFVGNKEDIMSCSCAAGSAFEGMHIEHGVKAVTGAIEKIKIDPRDYEVEYKTINDAKPIGICGSAMVDAIAEMFKCGIIDHRGHFNKNISSKRLRQENGVHKFVIAWREESGAGRDITISERDIQEIILAKAAIRSGIAVLMKEKGVREEGIDRVYIAGAFGNYLNTESALFVGLIPDIPLDRVRFVGNTAIAGAKMCLLSRKMRSVADNISRTIRYAELTVHPMFHKEFIDALIIPHRDLSKYPTVMKYLKESRRLNE